MLTNSLKMFVLSGAVVLSIGLAHAADQDQERIYGSQMMTLQERTEFSARMRAAKTAEEREKLRKEHHERMQVRAKERGVTLSDEPPVQGGGMMGPGGGMGQGIDMGQGGGRNR